MHSVSPTVTEVTTVGAFVALHPVAVAISRVTTIPHVHEIFFVNVPLPVVGADARTGGDGTVGQYGADGYARLTEIEMIPHLPFVIPQKTFASVVRIEDPFPLGLPDEIERAFELVGR